MSESQAKTVETNSAAETEALSAKLGASIHGGALITLTGELGAGKTVFVRGIARGLNMPAGVAITSPTYVLQHIYRGGRLTLYHIDAYRMVGGAGELEASGLAECFNDENGLVCVEWPERLTGFSWPSDRLEISIDHGDPQRRRISLNATGPRAAVVLNQLS